MRTRLTAVLAAALFWAGCASTPATPPGPPPPPPLRPLSPEAAAFFARAEAPGTGGALVVNLDALESLGLLGKGHALRQLAGIFGTTLPELATTMGDNTNAALVARGAVAASVLRHWAEWPSAQRFGVVVSQELLHGRPTPRPQWAQGVVALAVEERSPDNAKLLVGLAALGRSVTEELSREGAEVRLALKGSDLCMEGAELEVPVCLRPRPGLLLLGAPSALDAVESASRAAVPAPLASETAATPATPAAEATPLLVGLRVDMANDGRASLALTGRDAVRLALRIEDARPRSVSSIDRVVAKLLRDYDERQEEKRGRIAQALTEVQAALAQDATAPAELKASARALTVEQVVDEKGYWARMRQSVLIENATPGAYALSLTVPEGLVRDIAEQVSGGGLMTAGTLGALAAVAIPNFVKFQARSKQAEVRVNLKAAYAGQRAYAAAKDRWGRTFKDIGFSPELGRRYTYCMGTECLPCDRADCATPTPSPCKGITKVGRTLEEGFTLCAYGNVDQDEDLDVWVIDQDGVPQQLNADER